jgi:hypothetical protein
MAKKLTQKQLDGMFKAYCEKQSEHYVSQKCAISRNTVRKYKRLEGWDARLVGIQQKAQEKQDDNLAKILADNLKYVKYAKGKIIELMQVGGAISKNPVSDLDKMIRLELLLRGEADSRSEVIDRKLKDVPTEMLLKMQKELIDGNASRGFTD